jgi:hypothetical protein
MLADAASKKRLLRIDLTQQVVILTFCVSLLTRKEKAVWRKQALVPVVVVAGWIVAGCEVNGETSLGGPPAEVVASEIKGDTEVPAGDICDKQCQEEKKQAAAAEKAYLAAKYPRERGQAFDKLKTINAAILDIYGTALRDDFSAEYTTVVYAGKYNETYYFEPKRGTERTNDDGSTWWDTNVTRADYPPRPELSGVVVNVHNHIKNRGPESPVDNVKNVLPSIVVLSDGSIWVYPPKSAKAKPYGKIEKGQIKTAYNDIGDGLDPNFDIYAAGPGSQCGFWCSVWSGVATVGKVLLTVGAVGGIVFVASVSGAAGTTDRECCAGPPESGYDPDADPVQVCRRPDGDDCR